MSKMEGEREEKETYIQKERQIDNTKKGRQTERKSDRQTENGVIEKNARKIEAGKLKWDGYKEKETATETET